MNSDSVAALEESISKAIEVQPYVKSAKIAIDRSRFTVGGDTYSYLSLTGDMIDAVVVIGLDGVTVTAEMRYDNELKYPLMYVSKIE